MRWLRSAREIQRAWLWWTLCTAPVLCSNYQGNRAFVTAGKQAQCLLRKSHSYPPRASLHLPSSCSVRKTVSGVCHRHTQQPLSYISVYGSASEAYFDALQNLIGSLHTYHGDVIILVYDLGLSPGAGEDAIPWNTWRGNPFCERLTAWSVLRRAAEKLRQAQSFANCVVINFEAEVYPKHVRPAPPAPPLRVIPSTCCTHVCASTLDTLACLRVRETSGPRSVKFCLEGLRYQARRYDARLPCVACHVHRIGTCWVDVRQRWIDMKGRWAEV